jgi:hypothetical protein
LSCSVLHLLLKSFFLKSNLLVLFMDLVFNIKVMQLSNQIMRTLFLCILMTSWSRLNPDLRCCIRC